MPRYDFECLTCGNIQEIVRSLAEYADLIQLYCEKCGMMRFHSIVVGAPGVEDWGRGGQGRSFDELSPKGETFHSKGDYKRYLKDHGIVEWSPKRGMPGCDP